MPIWGGPYTLYQVGGLLLIPLMWMTRSWWAGRMSGLAVLAVIAVSTAGLVWLLGRIDFSGRNVIYAISALVAAWGTALQRAVARHTPGRGFRATGSPICARPTATVADSSRTSLEAVAAVVAVAEEPSSAPSEARPDTRAAPVTANNVDDSTGQATAMPAVAPSTVLSKPRRATLPAAASGRPRSSAAPPRPFPPYTASPFVTIGLRAGDDPAAAVTTTTGTSYPGPAAWRSAASLPTDDYAASAHPPLMEERLSPLEAFLAAARKVHQP